MVRLSLKGKKNSPSVANASSDEESAGDRELHREDSKSEGDLASAALSNDEDGNNSDGNNSDGSDLNEPDEEELLEELQDQMVRKIQSIYRSRRARILMKQLIKANYVKEIDPDSGHFCYRNKRTGDIQWTKPAILGSDDLDDPKSYTAPPNYQNTLPCVRYFSIVITNQTFSSAKIPDTNPAVLKDHQAISNILSHPYLCKFGEDDCIFLRDASRDAIINCFETVSGLIAKEAERIRQEKIAEVTGESGEGGRDENVLDDGSMSANSLASPKSSSSRASGVASPASSVVSSPSKSPSKGSISGGGSVADSSITGNSVTTLATATTSSTTTTTDSGNGGVDEAFEEADFRKELTLQREKIAATVRRLPPENQIGFLLYFSTHALTIQKSGSHDGIYFTCHDTSLKSSSQVRRSSLSLAKLCSFIKALPCVHKTCLLDLVHLDRPKDTLFKTKILYPNPEIYDKIATLGGCSVIGSCKCGVTGREAVKLMMEKKKKGDAKGKDLEEEEEEEEGKLGGGEKWVEAKGKKDENEGKKGEEEKVGKDDKVPDDVAGNAGLSQPPKKGQERFRGSMAFLKKELAEKEREEIAKKQAAATKGKKKVKANVFRRVRKRVADRIDAFNERRRKRFSLPPPTLTWTENDGYIVEVMDTTDVILGIPAKTRKYFARKRKNAWGAVKSGAVKLYNSLGERRLPGLEKALYGVDMGKSVFGSAVVKALGGAAAKDDIPNITADRLFRCLRKEMRIEVEKINELNREENPNCPLVSQVPMRGGSGKIDRVTFICSIPSVPAPPLPPYAVKLTDSAVHLRWSNPEMSGDPPIEYNIQARGKAKLNRVWHSVGTYSKIQAEWFNVVHLVAGVALQFRVRAANNGGWGDWSECSEYYTPYSNPIMPIAENMQVAIAIGAREVLSSMKKYYTALEAQQLGSKVLVTVATKDAGFKRGSVAKDCITVAVDAMKRFPLDNTLQSYACLLIGWACFARPVVAKEAKRLGAIAMINRAWEMFGKLDSTLCGNAQWAISQIEGKTDLRKTRERLIKKAARCYQEMLDEMTKNAEIAAADFAVRDAKERERRRQLGIKEEKQGGKRGRSRSPGKGGRGGRGRGRGRGGRGGRGRGRGSRSRSRNREKNGSVSG